jgi:uncharacterized protein YciI
MPRHFLVITTRGPSWDTARGRREQAGWHEHAAFMDALVERGTIILGGPLADPNDGDHTALLFQADSEDEIRRWMAEDPWSDRLLRIQDVQPWSLWLRARPPGTAPSQLR